MLDSLQKLADYARHRQQVISTLVQNLSRISDTMGGKSPQLIEFIQDASLSIGQAMTVLDDFQTTATLGPQFMTPVYRMLIDLGLSPDLDIDKLVSSVFSSATSAAATFRLLPAALEGLQAPQLQAGGSGAMNCGNGVAHLPAEVAVLLNGSKVVICNVR
jgi:phospholipid/cholesterol/gamma-HCH transport system substrate-binding protein